MAIVYEGEQETTGSTTASVPSGTADGDLLYAIVHDNGQSGAITGPSGWTQIQEHRTGVYSGYVKHMWCGYILVSGTPPSNYTWGNMGSNMSILIRRFSGVDSYGGSQIKTLPSWYNVYALSVTPDEDNCLVIWSCGGGDVDGVSSVPSPYTDWKTTYTSSENRYAIAHTIQTTAAATGNVTSTGWLNSVYVYQNTAHAWFRPAAAPAGGVLENIIHSRAVNRSNFF